MAVLLIENDKTVQRRNHEINAEKNAEILSDEKINAEENPSVVRMNFETTATKVADAENPRIPISASGF